MKTVPPTFAQQAVQALRQLVSLGACLDPLQPLAALGARLYVAQVFFLSGLTKLRDWDITLALFMDEYHVPLLPPEVAAYAGTAGELVLPVLLGLGLGGRFAALGLTVVNIVAVLSLSDIAPAALQQHISWGIVLVALAVFGSHPAWAPEWRLLVVTGFLGGLTTFSTFSAEVTTLIQQGRLLWAGLAISAHVVGSLAMTLLGLATVAWLKPT